MGWVSDKPGHEGFIVGLTEMESAAGNTWMWWRELGMRQGDETRRRVYRIQVGCECGWRSRVYEAPPRAEWFPYTVQLHNEAVEDEACVLWRRHLDDPEMRLLVPAREGP